MKKDDEILRYKPALDRFVYVKYKSAGGPEVLRFGILKHIFPGTLRICHKADDHIFWDIPLSRITEFSSERVEK